MIFQALKHLQPQWPQWPQWPHFIKIFTDPDGLIIPSTQMINTSPFLGNGSSKIQFFINFWYSFCRKLLRLAYVFFWRLVDETQISLPPEATRYHQSIKLLCRYLIRKVNQLILVKICKYISTCVLFNTDQFLYQISTSKKIRKK
jgi:hypothetical protein